MAVTLGIQVGHDAACAVVRDGRLVSAVSQERLTRCKHDGEEGFSTRLPIGAALQAAGVTIGEVDHIVSSVQAVSPGGYGLHRPLTTDDFAAFDLDDGRHTVISHHLAHAWSAFGTSGLDGAAIVVSDLGGTSSVDGRDFALPFNDWVRQLSGGQSAQEVRTECTTLYRASRRTITAIEKHYCVPHNAPESFVHSPASLYDNISRFVFGRDHAHGQLMALAAYGHTDAEWHSEQLIAFGPDGTIRYRNDWQHRVRWGLDPMAHRGLAMACQDATEAALLHYGRRCKVMTGLDNLCAAGGVFLNILANTAIATSGLFRQVHVPSAPHDAGVAVGCAFYGDLVLAEGPQTAVVSACRTDRLGPEVSEPEVQVAVDATAHLVEWCAASMHEIARELAAGAVVARWSGRSEFGPRALGGRSLLASPLKSDTKQRLNAIKGRQAWRPVAPVVCEERAGEFFDGPLPSPHMLFAHTVRSEHVGSLPALVHPDASTRAQTLVADDDSELYTVLVLFGSATGYPMLVNTSLNNRGEPIVESPADAIRMLLRADEIDLLWLGRHVGRRRKVVDLTAVHSHRIALTPGTIVSVVTTSRGARLLATRGTANCELPMWLADHLDALTRGVSIDSMNALASGESGWEALHTKLHNYGIIYFDNYDIHTAT